MYSCGISGQIFSLNSWLISDNFIDILNNIDGTVFHMLYVTKMKESFVCAVDSVRNRQLIVHGNICA